MSLTRFLRTQTLAYPLRQMDFDRRGFSVRDEHAKNQLGRSLEWFKTGYRLGLEDSRAERLISRLDGLERGFRGFAYEGAAMALTLLDLLTFSGKRRVCRLLDESEPGYAFLIHGGAGLAIGKLCRRIADHLDAFDPLLRLLIYDSYGFHQCYFHTTRYLQDRTIAGKLGGDSFLQSLFDQGMGRGIWFAKGADPCTIAAVIGAFPHWRQANLWQGVGVAATYAGGVGPDTWSRLQQATKTHLNYLAQGVCMAAAIRVRSANLVPHNETASRSLWQTSAKNLGELGLAHMPKPTAATYREAYTLWGQTLRDEFDKRRIAPRLINTANPLPIACD